MAVTDRRRVERGADEEMVQMNVQMPQELRKWLTRHALERHETRAPGEKRVSISSVMRELAEGLRADPDRVRELLEQLRRPAEDAGGRT
jgi:hypothetical protein